MKFYEDIYEDNELIVETIKLAVCTTSYLGISMSKIYKEIILRLSYYYYETKDETYLKAALLHMRAYMQMGFDYNENASLFDDILQILDTNRQEMFPNKYYSAQKIKLTKQNIKNMIVKWPSSKYRINFEDVVEDIIYKISNHIEGIHYYNSNPRPDKQNNEGGDLYELVINTDEIYFHDIKRKKYYKFNV